LCIRVGATCLINTDTIERWGREIEEGKAYVRPPGGVNCRRCSRKKKACELPATKVMKEAISAKVKTRPRRAVASTARSETSRALSSKRKELVGVEMPPPKRARQEAQGKSDAGLQEVLVGLLQDIRGDVGRLADAAESSAAYHKRRVEGMELFSARTSTQNQLLGAILEAMKTRPGPWRREEEDVADAATAAQETTAVTPEAAAEAVSKAAAAPASGQAADVPMAGPSRFGGSAFDGRGAEPRVAAEGEDDDESGDGGDSDEGESGDEDGEEGEIV